MSRFDQYYRRVALGTIYREGWGSVKDLAKIVHYRRTVIGNREKCNELVPKDYPIKIEKELKFKDYNIIEGNLLSPFNEFCPDLMPDAIKTAKFQLILPKVWKTKHRPIVFHFAGTGDQNYWRRRLLLAKPLLSEHSVASLILENPFYGARKPKNQTRSNLNQVKDLFVMGGCLVTEALALMNWCERLGFGPFLLTGLSMGGHMASLASTVWPKPLAVVPCLSWTTAGPTFTRGVMAKSIPWEVLHKQYFENKGYQKIKEDLIILSEKENSKRAPENKQICSFLNNSPDPIDFNKLDNYNTPSGKKEKPVHPEIIEFMHILMDECTHLLNFDKPVDTSLIKVISAKEDCYILRDGVNDFKSIYNIEDNQVEYLDRGHVGAFLLSQNRFRQTIVTMLNKLIEKHYIT